jgi:hypothetical protein
MMKWKTLIVLMVFLTGACTRPASTLDLPPAPTDELRLCGTSDLQTSSSSNDAGGSIVFGVTLVNTSESPCILAGPPPVTLSGNGKPLKIEYLQADTEPLASPAPAALRIAPGESAIAILVWENYCGETLADGLTIHLGLTIDQSLEIQADRAVIPPCEAKNKPSTLTIYPYSYPP